MSALPKQVQRQAEEAEAIEQQMRAKPGGEAPPDAAGAEASDAPRTETAPPTQAEAPPTASEAVAPPPKAENFEVKYRTLQGMFNAEVGKLQQQVKDLMARNQTIEQQLAAASQAPQVTESLITDKDRAEFGEDMLDVQRRVAEEVLRKHVAPLQQELAARDRKIEQLERMVGATGSQLDSLTFEQKLESRVPGFAKLNTTPAWIAWLDAIVPDTGQPRRVYAQAAFEAGDVEQVARFAEAFRATQKPQAGAADRQAELQRQVVPPKSDAPVSTQGQRVYTEAEYNRLWDRCVLLARNGKTADSAALEAELTSAAHQGRVR